MRYSKDCECKECNNAMSIEYLGKNILSRKGDLTKMDKLTLNTVYFSFKTDNVNRDIEGRINTSIRVSPSEIPTIINKLQEAYKEYEEIQEVLKKYGKLEVSVQDNEANLSVKGDKNENENKDLEKKFEFDKKLPSYYPLVELNGKLVKYNPNKHELEKGESVAYFDFEEQKIKEGIIELVEHSNPMNLRIYTINGKSHMHHRIWPKIEENKVNLSAQENKGIIVDKSKATRRFNTRETQFTKNSRLNH